MMKKHTKMIFITLFLVSGTLIIGSSLQRGIISSLAGMFGVIVIYICGYFSHAVAPWNP